MVGRATKDRLIKGKSIPFCTIADKPLYLTALDVVVAKINWQEGMIYGSTDSNITYTPNARLSWTGLKSLVKNER